MAHLKYRSAQFIHSLAYSTLVAPCCLQKFLVDEPWKAQQSKLLPSLLFLPGLPQIQLSSHLVLVHPHILSHCRLLCREFLLPTWLHSEHRHFPQNPTEGHLCVETFPISPGENNCSLHCFPAVLPTGFFKPLSFCKFNSLVSVYLSLYITTTLRIEAEAASISVSEDSKTEPGTE